MRSSWARCLALRARFSSVERPSRFSPFSSSLRRAFDEAGLPMLYVFRNCRDTRRTLPLLRYDAHAPEDVDTRQEDHIADEIRYLCQSDPIAPRPVVQRTPKVFDPLSSD